MRSTPPLPTVSERNDARVVEDLCLALRNVGVREHALPSDPRAVGHVEDVQELARELERRGVDFSGRLQRLSEETGWLMPELLEECCGFPAVTPRVRFREGQLRSDVVAAKKRDEEKQAVLRQTKLQPFVDVIQQVIFCRVPDASARADLLAALEKRAIRYLLEELPKHLRQPLSKTEWETMHRLMFEWG